MIRHVNDPEHPLTLEQLKVVSVSWSLRHIRPSCCVALPVSFFSQHLRTVFNGWACVRQNPQRKTRVVHSRCVISFSIQPGSCRFL